VTDSASHLTGSVYTDVVVPDFVRDKVSMSGLVLTRTPSVAVAGREVLNSLLPIVPTTARDFAAGDDVDVFAQLYQAAKGAPSPVAIRIAIRDEHDQVVRDLPATVDATSFSAPEQGPRRRILAFPLQLSTLAPGAYLLTVTAGVGKASVHNDVQFRVH
jgi:hypothetical protein